jgi:hypothetical protein
MERQNDLKKVIEIWVYSNFHIALIAFLLSLESNYILGIESDFKGPFFVFFSTLFIYNLGYYQAILFKKPAQRFHAEWMIKHIKYWIFSMLLSLIAILYLFSSFSYNAKIVIIVLSLISFFYIIHGVKIGKVNVSVRNIPFLKTIIVSLVWSLITIVPQAIDHEIIETSNSILPLILERFLFVLSITLMFDIRDMQSDPDSLATIPRLIGVNFTKGFALIALGFSFYFLIEIQMITPLFLMIIVFSLMLLSILFSSTKRQDLFYSAWFDGLMGLHAIFIIYSFI